jgi:hypothetical protein
MAVIVNPTDLLRRAVSELDHNYANAGAIALVGLFATVVASDERDNREEEMRAENRKLDDALGRVLNLADSLHEQTGASLKPAAFPELARRIIEAVYPPQDDGEAS